MAETDESTQSGGDAPKARGKAWLLAIPAIVLLGGGGFYATYAGLIGGPATAASHTPEAVHKEAGFLDLDPLTLTVGARGNVRQLRFRSVLELGESPGGVSAQMPRILDVMAGYLRALPVDTLEDPTALLRIRAQLLRRIQLLCGPDAVDDLLILDFVMA